MWCGCKDSVGRAAWTLGVPARETRGSAVDTSRANSVSDDE
jgi:hypothetical protein